MVFCHQTGLDFLSSIDVPSRDALRLPSAKRQTTLKLYTYIPYYFSALTRRQLLIKFKRNGLYRDCRQVYLLPALRLQPFCGPGLPVRGKFWPRRPKLQPWARATVRESARASSKGPWQYATVQAWNNQKHPLHTKQSYNELTNFFFKYVTRIQFDDSISLPNNAFNISNTEIIQKSTNQYILYHLLCPNLSP